MNNTVLQLVADFCKPALVNQTDVTWRLRAAFNQSLDFHEILSPVDDETLFKGAFLAVYEISGSEDRIALLENMQAVIVLSQIVGGEVSALDKLVEPVRSIPLLKLWNEAKPTTNFPPKPTPTDPSNEERNTG